MRALFKKAKKYVKFLIANLFKVSRQLLRSISDCFIKVFKRILQFFESVINYFCHPAKFIRKINNNVALKITLTVICISFLLIGTFFNANWKFNYFYIFYIFFFLILFGSIYSLNTFVKITDEIRSLTINMQGFHDANTFFTRYELSIVYALIPSAVVLVFGVGGTILFESAIVTPTFIWILCLFALVVHLSIIGYLQYVLLLLYIRKIAIDKADYKSLLKPTQHTIPTEVNWVLKLTKLYHKFRSAFFTIGSIYIIAYSCFCFLPGFDVNYHNPMFLILWIIIIMAVVLVFPITAIMEFMYIKKIVKKMKKSYIKDLINETQLFKNEIPDWYSTSLQMISNLFTVSVNNLDDYPIKNRISEVYAYFIALINLIGSIGSVIQLISSVSFLV